jgi:hypothetical protein
MGISGNTTTTIRIAGSDQLILMKENYPRWKTSTLESFKGLNIDWMFRTDGRITTAEQKHLADALGSAAVYDSDGVTVISKAVLPRFSDEYIKADLTLFTKRVARNIKHPWHLWILLSRVGSFWQILPYSLA